MATRNVLEKLQESNPQAEIWWDSAPLVYGNWARGVLAKAPSGKQAAWQEQLARLKNNSWFLPTSRKMMDEVANHATQIGRAVERYGLEAVESFVDACLSLENLTDPTFPFAPRPARPSVPSAAVEEAKAEELPRLPAKAYMDSFINPREYLEQQRKSREEKTAQAKRFPAEPSRDIMLFPLEHAPLERWQQNDLSIIRDEAYYFMPQGQTKIMNEGWATFWHSELMTKRLLGIKPGI